jgi:hypothetical protein
MGDDRKKPGVAFWATVGLVVVLVGYPLSFGPACWINQRKGIGGPAIATVYRPIAWVYAHAGEPIRRFIGWYASFGAELKFYGWSDYGPVWIAARK